MGSMTKILEHSSHLIRWVTIIMVMGQVTIMVLVVIIVVIITSSLPYSHLIIDCHSHYSNSSHHLLLYF